MLSFLVAFPLLAAQHAVPAAPQALPEIDRERLSQIARAVGREAVEHEGVPGVSVAVTAAGEPLVALAFGWADVKAGQTATPSTRFAVGSLTRQFTAAAVLQLAEQKKLGLDEPVTKYLPAFPAQQGAPTLRQLLANRSGVPGWAQIAARHPEAAQKELDEAAFFALFADLPFEFAPGSGFSLDSAGYVLLSMVVQKVAGAPFADVVTRDLIEAAGLDDTAFCPGDQRPVGYAADCKEISRERELEIPMPAAPSYATQSLCTTALDMARWQDALYTGGLLSDASLRTFLAPVGTGDDEVGYGCAVGTARMEDFVRRAHVGGIGGFRVCAAYYPAARVSVVVLANCATAPVDRIEAELARAVHGLPPLTGEFALRPEEERRLPGDYMLGTTRVHIAARDGHLWYEEAGQSPLHLRSRGRGDFAFEGERDARVVFDLEGERATWFALIRRGTTSRAVRAD